MLLLLKCDSTSAAGVRRLVRPDRLDLIRLDDTVVRMSVLCVTDLAGSSRGYTLRRHRLSPKDSDCRRVPQAVEGVRLHGSRCALISRPRLGAEKPNAALIVRKQRIDTRPVVIGHPSVILGHSVGCLIVKQRPKTTVKLKFKGPRCSTRHGLHANSGRVTASSHERGTSNAPHFKRRPLCSQRKRVST